MSPPDIPSEAPPRSVLLLTPGFGDGGDDACTALLEAASAPNLLYVSYTGGFSERSEHYAAHADESATVRGIVVGDAGADGGGDVAEVETVSAPTDLTGVGIAVTELLQGAEGRTAVCFDSITALLQYVDVDTAYEFLHVVVGRLYGHDATGHLHMDPTAHDDVVVERMTSLVDGRLRLSKDGEVVDRRASPRTWGE